jgi:RimJ/RimL family protein N-acetyltransferase
VIVYGDKQLLLGWAGKRLGMEFDERLSEPIGVENDGEILAVAVINNVRWPNAEISFVMASPRWATRTHIAGIFAYPFLQLGMKRLSAVTEVKNQPARAFLCRLGFKQEGYHPEAFPSGDGVSYGLLREDAQCWLKERWVVESTSSAKNL